MKYEKQLKQLIEKILEPGEKSTVDLCVSCPQPGCGHQMEFGLSRTDPKAWVCINSRCDFRIPEEELPSPKEIEKLIKQIDVGLVEEIKNIIRKIDKRRICSVNDKELDARFKIKKEQIEAEKKKKIAYL